MARIEPVLKWHDHAAALLATLVMAHCIGLAELAGWMPQGLRASRDPAGLLLGAAVCGLTYVIMLGAFYGRRLVSGPLYRCAETRPADAFGKAYQPGTTRLLDSWHYR